MEALQVFQKMVLSKLLEGMRTLAPRTMAEERLIGDTKFRVLHTVLLKEEIKEMLEGGRM